MRLRPFGLLLALSSPVAAAAQAAPQSSSMPNVSVTLAFARQYAGVLHVGIALKNASGSDASQSAAVKFSDIVLIDAAGKRKHFIMKDAEDHFLAGPISDWNDGGRWFPRVAAKGESFLWALFEAVPAGARLSLEVAGIATIDSVVPTDAPPPAQARHPSSQPPVVATLLGATRSAGQLKVQIKLDSPDTGPPLGGAALLFRDVFALDPAGKRKYPLLKSQAGQFLAEPRTDLNDGGRLFLADALAKGQRTLTLTFQPPPDSVQVVDIVVPSFPPFEGIRISGTGGAGGSGVAVAGRSEALEEAMKELNATETTEDIHVNLSADVLFDFDRDTLKPAAETALRRVATVIGAYPRADVYVEGHTDGKGSDSYNQPLSERRAAAVGAWLTSHADLPAPRLHTRGWGKTKPVAPNVRPDGSDDPDGRAKNRRVEIVVKK